MRERRLVPVLIAVAMVTSVVSSLGAPLIPSVAESLDVSLHNAQWSLTAALLGGVVAAPIMGRLADGRHRRRTIVGALAMVVVGSAIAGLAQSLPLLIVGRALQGVGLGLAPLTMVTAHDYLGGERGLGVVAALSVAGAAGVGVGYPLSGLIAQTFDVQAAFLFGGVLTAVVLFAALVVVPVRQPVDEVPLDVNGAVRLSVGLIALVLAISEGPNWGWLSAGSLTLIGVAITSLTFWIRSQLERTNPLVELRILARPAVITADVAAFSLGIAMYMFLTLVTEFVQVPASTGYGFGASTLMAGLCLVPFSVASLVASRAVRPLTRRLSSSSVIVAGTLVIACAGAFFAMEHRALWEAFLTIGVVGIGFGLTFGAIPTLIATAVPNRERGSALGLYQVVRSVGFTLGSALVAALLAAHTPSGATFPTEAGYVVALWTGAAVCALSAVASMVLGRLGDVRDAAPPVAPSAPRKRPVSHVES